MPIYFIQEVPDGAIKIGVTAGDPYARLAAMQTGNSSKLNLLCVVPGDASDEAKLHERFADLRIRGEWFRPDARLIGFVHGLVYAYGEPEINEAYLDGAGRPDLNTERGFEVAGLTGEQLSVILGFVEAHRVYGRVVGLIQSAQNASGNPNEVMKLLRTAIWLVSEASAACAGEGSSLGPPSKSDPYIVGFSNSQPQHAWACLAKQIADMKPATAPPSDPVSGGNGVN